MPATVPDTLPDESVRYNYKLRARKMSLVATEMIEPNIL